MVLVGLAGVGLLLGIGKCKTGDALMNAFDFFV
jgi:hypothetical protein